MLRLDLRLEEGEAPNPPTAATTKREREEEEPIAWFIGNQIEDDDGHGSMKFLSFGWAPNTEKMMQQVRNDLALLPIDKRGNDNWIEEFGLRPLAYPEQKTSLIDPARFTFEHLLKLYGIYITIKQGDTFLRGEKFLQDGQKWDEWMYNDCAVFYPELIDDERNWNQVKEMIWSNKFQNLTVQWHNLVREFSSMLQGANKYLGYCYDLVGYQTWSKFETNIAKLANEHPEVYKKLNVDALVAETKEQARKTNEFIETLQTKRRKTT